MHSVSSPILVRPSKRPIGRDWGIALPDCRSAQRIGLGDMDGTAASKEPDWEEVEKSRTARAQTRAVQF